MREQSQSSVRKRLAFLAAMVVAAFFHAQAAAAQVMSNSQVHSAGLDPPSFSLRGRSLKQEDLSQPGSGSGGVSDLVPCGPLLNILGESMNSTLQWGKFTEPPTQQLLQDCVAASSVYIPDGYQLRVAVKEELPVVKVMHADQTLIVPSPIALAPSAEFYLPGSVVVLDCQENWIDFRQLPVQLPIDAVLVFVRCHVLLLKNGQGSTSQTWLFSSSSHRPCNVRSHS